jgi:cold shock CspA family protein/ribosome-associated translation inhibitor RaiA
MQVPPEIVFRDVPRTPAVDRAIEEGIAQLEGVHDRIMACRIAAELPHKRQKSGNLFRVRVDLTIPGAEIVVSRLPPDDHSNDDIVVAIADAFDTVRTRLLEHERKRRSSLKPIEAPPKGHVVKIFPGDGYGFVESVDGRELYFHENSVQGRGFSALEVGQAVRFTEELGDKGPQAIVVIPA